MIFIKNEGEYWLGSKPITPGEGEKAAETWESQCPYGRPGDLLYVREKWEITDVFMGKGAPIEVYVKYYADGMKKPIVVRDNLKVYQTKGVKPSIHMPKEISRIWLMITDVRVERLHQINTWNILSEGLRADPISLDPDHSLKKRFRKLWDDINFDRGFGFYSNPWVWVIQFEVGRIEKINR